MASTYIPEFPAYEASGMITCRRMSPGTTASGRKRKSESDISNVFDVRFAPNTGRWDDRVVRGRWRPEALHFVGGIYSLLDPVN